MLVLAPALVLDRLAAAGRERPAAVHFAGVGTGIALSAVMVAGLGRRAAAARPVAGRRAGLSWRGPAAVAAGAGRSADDRYTHPPPPEAGWTGAWSP